MVYIPESSGFLIGMPDRGRPLWIDSLFCRQKKGYERIGGRRADLLYAWKPLFYGMGIFCGRKYLYGICCSFCSPSLYDHHYGQKQIEAERKTI